MRSDYTDEFDAFSESLSRTLYRFGAGLDPRLELEPVYDRYGYLFSSESIGELAVDSTEAFSERDRKAAKYLRAVAIEEHLALKTREIDEAIADHDAAATVTWEGQPVPYLALRSRIRNESRSDARRSLGQMRERIVEGANDLRAERLEKRHEAAVNLGAASMNGLWAEANGIDYGALADRVGVLLSATEDRYATSLAVMLRRRAGVTLPDATRDDLLHAGRLGEFDAAFPAHRMPVVYRDTFAGLGIRTGAQENISLDLDDRPTKNPRPFCSAIRVPDEVVLVVRPSGGYLDYSALLHEGGHAQHFGTTSGDVHVAFARAGDRASSEVWAFLMQYLLLDPLFVHEKFGLDSKCELIRIAAVEKCAVVRRHAGKLRYEEALHSGRTSLASAAASYVEHLDEATLLRHARADAFADMDDGYYVADYLRAWALEVMIREHFRTRFGRRWWTSRAAGDLLRELWSTGSEYSADEIGSELGLGPIAFDPLADDLREGLAA